MFLDTLVQFTPLEPVDWSSARVSASKSPMAEPMGREMVAPVPKIFLVTFAQEEVFLAVVVQVVII